MYQLLGWSGDSKKRVNVEVIGVPEKVPTQTYTNTYAHKRRLERKVFTRLSMVNGPGPGPRRRVILARRRLVVCFVRDTFATGAAAAARSINDFTISSARTQHSLSRMVAIYLDKV